MTFEIDPPDEPCPDCGSVHHRECDAAQVAERVAVIEWMIECNCTCKACSKLRKILEQVRKAERQSA